MVWGCIPLVFHLVVKSLFYSFTPRSIYPQYLLNISLCGLEKGLLRLAGIEPGLVGFKTCSLFTIVTVLFRLPLLAISCFVDHTMAETLHSTALISAYFCVLDIETASGWRKVGVTELKYPVVFMVKQLIFIINVVWSDTGLLLLTSILWPLSVSDSEQNFHSPAPRSYLYFCYILS